MIRIANETCVYTHTRRMCCRMLPQNASIYKVEKKKKNVY